ncbi:uncharacterized protein LOC129906429 [Episyrphus balteatus]|uniref:uncharacterized protein LOC129906429 n=1 Tax=Episyrphus balteatus TaxID=286459 RepID=UPI002485072A|nr:uncharacterized protein LOC129906429 [Episyrphus balteatus]
MSFVVGNIQINDKITMCYVVVPANWLAGTVVYWPQHLPTTELDKLRKDPSSLPNKDIWQQKNFTFMTMAKSYELAETMSTNLQSKHINQFPPIIINMKNEEKDLNSYQEEESETLIDSKENQQQFKIDYSFDYDDLDQKNITETCNHNIQLNEMDGKISNCLFQNTETHFKLDNFAKTLDLVFHKIGLEANLPFDKFKDIDDFADRFSSKAKIDQVDEKIEKCLLANELTHMKIDSLQKSLDDILKNVESNVIDLAEDPLSDSAETESYKFPISTVTELNRLDKELEHNKILMSKLVNKFTKIAGDSGNKLAKLVGVKIVERIISPKLLTKFTWTGRHQVSKDVKLPFMVYSSIFNLCLQVISKADHSFGRKECEHFLKQNILKHSILRFSRKFNKKTNRRKGNWCSESRTIINPSELKFESKKTNLQKSDTEEVEEMIKLKEYHGITNNPDIGEESLPTENSFMKKCDHEDKLDNMDIKISHCIKSNTKVHQKIDDMQKTLNLILSKIIKNQSVEPDSVHVPSSQMTDITNCVPILTPVPEIVDEELDSLHFPLTTVQDLKDLNKKLATSENFEKKMINKFIGIAGNSKTMSVQRFGLAVVENVIPTQLLMKYSWTGRSRGNNSKLSFMKYKALISFFQKIISKADDRFTRKECEDFLRHSVFKYVNLRVARKRRKDKDSSVSECSLEKDADEDIIYNVSDKEDNMNVKK